MFRYLIKTLLSLALIPWVALAEEATENVDQVESEVNTSLKNSKFTISDGSRVELEGKNFSIVPPEGWEVHQAYPNTTLLMQVPFKSGQAYQRTIQVMRFTEPVPIDEVTAQEFEEVIEQKFSKASPSITEYRIRNHMVTELEDKSPGILFYSEFILDGHSLMQAHILISSSDNRFLVTYTDLASHFEGEEASEFLTEAWSSMVTMHLESSPPMRLRQSAVLGFGIGFFTLFILLFLAVRRYRAGRVYGDLIGDPYDEKNESYLHSGMSHINSHVSGKQPHSFAIVSKEAELEEFENEKEGGGNWNLKTNYEELGDPSLSKFDEDEVDPKAS